MFVNGYINKVHLIDLSLEDEYYDSDRIESDVEAELYAALHHGSKQTKNIESNEESSLIISSSITPAFVINTNGATNKDVIKKLEDDRLSFVNLNANDNVSVEYLDNLDTSTSEEEFQRKSLNKRNPKTKMNDNFVKNPLPEQSVCLKNLYELSSDNESPSREAKQLKRSFKNKLLKDNDKFVKNCSPSSSDISDNSLIEILFDSREKNLNKSKLRTGKKSKVVKNSSSKKSKNLVQCTLENEQFEKESSSDHSHNCIYSNGYEDETIINKASKHKTNLNKSKLHAKKKGKTEDFNKNNPKKSDEYLLKKDNFSDKYLPTKLNTDVTAINNIFKQKSSLGNSNNNKSPAKKKRKSQDFDKNQDTSFTELTDNSIIEILQDNDNNNSDSSVIVTEPEMVEKNIDTVLLSSDSSSNLSDLNSGECDFSFNFNQSANEFPDKIDSSLWAINDQDRFAYRSRNGHFNSFCSRCHQRGHSKVFCTTQKMQHCLNCGEFHHTHKCPNIFCHKCSNYGHDSNYCNSTKHPICMTCKMFGHTEKQCPDIWRKYHLTTCKSNFIKGKSLKQNCDIYCSNCGQKGHYSAQCFTRKRFATSPAVVSYQKFEKEKIRSWKSLSLCRKLNKQIKIQQKRLRKESNQQSPNANREGQLRNFNGSTNVMQFDNNNQVSSSSTILE